MRFVPGGNSIDCSCFRCLSARQPLVTEKGGGKVQKQTWDDYNVCQFLTSEKHTHEFLLEWALSAWLFSVINRQGSDHPSGQVLLSTWAHGFSWYAQSVLYKKQKQKKPDSWHNNDCLSVIFLNKEWEKRLQTITNKEKQILHLDCWKVCPEQSQHKCFTWAQRGAMTQSPISSYWINSFLLLWFLQTSTHMRTSSLNGLLIASTLKLLA